MELAEIIQSHRPEDAGESFCHVLCMVMVAPGAQHLHLRGAVSSHLSYLTRFHSCCYWFSGVGYTPGTCAPGKFMLNYC
jgi:hypothetical protein